MVGELQPVSLTDAARELGVGPFEVVRLLVAADEMPPGRPTLSRATLRRLRELAGLEASWWSSIDLPDDPDARVAMLRAALGALLARDLLDDAQTRLDNVTRGLDSTDQRWLTQALHQLADEGLLCVRVRPEGVGISVVSEAVGQVRAICEGGEAPPGLAGLHEG